ncbi:hypothetical protein DFH09DRAFT_155284 [Mycena vulgaris]|nr:hypothetical protein DFH09DRAFT_155284 [Mycena vulgaris]
MAPTTIICAILLVLRYYGGRILWRRTFSPLDNVPGPPRKSLLTGNLTQYHDPDGWEFQREIEEDYAEVVKIHGLCGDRGLFVFDPAALESILVHGHDRYEQMPMNISMNSLFFGRAYSLVSATSIARFCCLRSQTITSGECSRSFTRSQRRCGVVRKSVKPE